MFLDVTKGKTKEVDELSQAESLAKTDEARSLASQQKAKPLTVGSEECLSVAQTT
jgi:hypothetical protein